MPDNFTDQMPHVVSAEDLTRPWGGKRDGSLFRCYLCGHTFEEGDTYRWVCSNGTPGAGGNPMVCAACDARCDHRNEKVIEAWRVKHDEWKRMKRAEWWWFVRDVEDAARR